MRTCSANIDDELHANEIVLLAYYIAAIHIEEAFHGRLGDNSDYEPFGGIVLTDTFNLHTERTGFLKDWLPDNSERVERQQTTADSGGRWESAVVGGADGVRRTRIRMWTIQSLKQRVAETYAARSTATNEEQPLRYLQDGDPLGVGSDRGTGCRGVS